MSERKKRVVEFIEGLTILEKYDHGGFGCHAEHDIFYAGDGDPANVSEEDAKKLKALSWFIDSETESWAKFT